MSVDPAARALLHPFAEGRLAWPERALWLRARAQPLASVRDATTLAATQPLQPEASQLQRAGVTLVDEDALPEAAYPLLLVLPTRQREESRALFAKACAAVAPGGVVVVAAANDAGAKALQADLERLAGALVVVSKAHCRVFWTRPDAECDAERIAAWRVLDAPRRIASDAVPGGGFCSRPGVFAWDRVDAASALLAAALPADLQGCVADFGAGWGYLSLQVLARCPAVASLDLFEADARALELARRNLAGARVPVGLHWEDVTGGVAQRFDAIVCNPPFHGTQVGQRPDLGRAFIAAAAHALKPGGALWLVANRHLPYESALGAGFARVHGVAQAGGFKIVHAVKA